MTALEPGDDGFGFQDRRKFRTNLTSQANDHFNFGAIRWITGDNTKYAPMEVKDYATSNGFFEMQLQLANDVDVNDEFIAYAGCDRLKTTCDVKFSNLDNFGGFEFIPGPDRLAEKVPDFIQG